MRSIRKSSIFAGVTIAENSYNSLKMQRIHIILCLLFCVSALHAETYIGRITDEQGTGIGYATVYLAHNPIIGTATNDNGYFTLTTDEPVTSFVIVSFLGYEKQEVTLAYFLDDSTTLVLREQPIALQEMVISAPAVKQRNKRKQMAALLSQVYNQMVADFPEDNVRYRVVSDVRMDTENEPWGMEQMIASSVLIPHANHVGEDSIQFAGEHCKRFYSNGLRSKADTLLSSEKMDKRMRQAANEVDSGVVVHQVLWTRDIKHAFAKRMEDPRHWKVSNENEGETVLTYTEKKNYLGIFQYEFNSHFIINSTTYSVLRFSEDITMAVNIPFGYKLKGEELAYINLLNVSGEEITKFRVRKLRGKIQMNTIYQIVGGKLCPKEKNLVADARILGTKKAEIPIHVRATQRATNTQTVGVQPLQPAQLNNRVKREIVEIY